MGFDFGVGIPSSLRVVRLDRLDRARGDAMTALELADALGRKAFRKVTWRHGSKAKLISHFCFVRVKTTHDDGLTLADHEPLWLVAEWLDGETKPTKFTLTTLPRRMSRKQIVRIFKERWRTERMYEDLKGELGLDHFEGRSFTGWHHHVSVVLCCYAFVISERVSAFPPSAGGAVETVRSPSRPERHFADSFITARLAIALFLARWLPRCPLCHQPHPPSRCPQEQPTRAA